MQTILEALRAVLGEADFYETGSGYSGTWDYGAMIEYFVGALILCIVVSSVFRLVALLFRGKNR